MKQIIIVIAIVLSSYLTQQSYAYWQEFSILKSKNLKELEDIYKSESSIQNLSFLKDQTLGDVKDAYKLVNRQMRLFSRNHNFKTTLEFMKINKNGYVKEVEEASPWIGIRQMSLILNFYEIKNVDQHMLTYEFLDALETSNVIHLSSIVQKGDCLEANVQIYGRDL